MRLEFIWVAREPEVEDHGARVVPERAVALAGDDLTELQALAPDGVTLTTGSGTVGKGAAGPGVALYLDVAEHVLNEGVSLIALAAAVKAIVGRVNTRRNSVPTISDPTSLAVAAVAAAPDEVRDQIRVARYVQTVPITANPGWGPTAGISGLRAGASTATRDAKATGSLSSCRQPERISEPRRYRQKV